MNKRYILLLVSLSASLSLLAGCNLPFGRSTPTLDVTQAYQTVEARLTEVATLTPLNTSSLPPSDNDNATRTPTPIGTTTLATSSPLPSATALTKLCDQAAPGIPIDVTIPDDTKMEPGEAFTKVWRLQNVGTCTWNKNYSISLFSGEAMGAPAGVPMPQAVASGQTVDISVDLVAPQEPGTYQGNWKLRNASNTWFGIGPNGSSPFWVRIVVGQPPTGTATVTSTSSGTGPTNTATPNIQVSGTTALIPSDKINLDTIQINVGSGEDLSYEQTSQGILLLTPINGARISAFGDSTPTISNCQAAPLSETSLALENLHSGLYLCYRTNQGLFGWMRLLNFNATNFTLTMQVLTWAVP